MNLHDDPSETNPPPFPAGEPEPVPTAVLMGDLERWKKRAEVAEAEVVRLRGHFSAAQAAATDAQRVFEDALRWWR